MNGPQHYTEAESLLDFADSAAGRGTGEAEQAIAAAQVHATLALVAAIIETHDESHDARNRLAFHRDINDKSAEEGFRSVPATPWAHAFKGGLS